MTEACDDGNTINNDGCSSTCALVETPGWTCSGGSFTTITTCSPICGDGLILGSETCDDNDGTPANSDGCDTSCQVESGWTCTGTSNSVCSEICGDGIIVGIEECDDHNILDNDGCHH